MQINTILVIDKREVSKSIFEANYYSNYTFKYYCSSISIEEHNIMNSELIFVFIYDPSDLINVIPLYNRKTSLIIIYSDPTLLLDTLEYAYSIDISVGLEKVKMEIKSILDFIVVQDT